MSRVLLPFGVVVFLAGCANGTTQEPTPIYEAVLKHEFLGNNKDQEIFLFIDGKDPAPELLKRLRQHLPKLEVGSKVPEGRATRIDLGELKTDRDHAELCGTVSNGIDGRARRFWLARKGGIWVVEKTKIEAES